MEEYLHSARMEFTDHFIIVIFFIKNNWIVSNFKKHLKYLMNKIIATLARNVLF